MLAKMMAVAACAFGLCCNVGSARAGADILFTWETFSATAAQAETEYPPPPLSLSFEVSGDVSFQADSVDLGATAQTGNITYAFPPQLVSFSLHDDQLNVTKSDFIEVPGFDQPDWSISLTTVGTTADLSLRFNNFNDTAGINYYQNFPGPVSTSGGTFDFDSDGTAFDGVCPCTYTGRLVARVPEPRSLAVLIAGLGMLALVRRRRGRGSRGVFTA